MGICFSGSSSSTPVLQRSNTVKQLEDTSAQLSNARQQAGRKSSLPRLAKLNRTTNAMLEQASARVDARNGGEDTEGLELETGMTNQQLIEQMGSLAQQWQRA